jgi:porphobilinogen synthase
MYPLRRNRRLRTNPAIRAMVRETSLSPADFLTPLFIVEGKGVKEEIPSMPGYYRLSLDCISKEVTQLWDFGLRAVLLFVKVPDALKDNTGKEALNREGLMQRAIKTIKDTCPDMYVLTDVALDPFSSFGHDGIVEKGRILNDPTVEVLSAMSVSHAEAGADMVAPSDMMDGRILGIRKSLDAAGFQHTGIMSYSAKYASAFYGPFRDALDSAPADTADVPADKKTYQMDPGNRREAFLETAADIEEGADIVMVKPGLCYLDIVRDLREAFDVPIAVYQVSGEYAMVKAAAARGWLDHDSVMMEQLTGIKRAGADLIATYFAKEASLLLNS